MEYIVENHDIEIDQSIISNNYNDQDNGIDD
jgi:hypothetical protein